MVSMRVFTHYVNQLPFRMKTPSKLAAPAGHTSTATSSITMSQVRATVESEMDMLKERYVGYCTSICDMRKGSKCYDCLISLQCREPEDLTDPSTAEMSRRFVILETVLILRLILILILG